jgi:hypothetical protein
VATTGGKTELSPEKVIGVVVVGMDGTLVVHAGKRHTSIKGYGP